MKIAETFEQVEEKKLNLNVVADPYLNAFAEKMMKLSNTLAEDEWVDIDDIKEDYLPAIREFILNITGL